MLRITAVDGRIAWYCGEDPAHAAELAAELFPGLDVTIDDVEEAAQG